MQIRIGPKNKRKDAGKLQTDWILVNYRQARRMAWFNVRKEENICHLKSNFIAGGFN